MVKRRTTKRKQFNPKDYMMPVYKGTWQSMYAYWNNPAMWSDQVTTRTLRYAGGKPYSARDVRSIIKSYCKVMREYVKKSKNW